MSDEEDSEYGNNLYLGEVFGEIITSGNNQNIICLVEAKQGKGKSWGAMSIACGASVHLASKLGGIPSDYFNINNVGIIMPDAIADVIINMKKYQIVIIDDAGMAYSGRKWQSAGNEAMNNMLQTMRTDNNIIIITVPDSDWIDKIGRNILHFKIVMKQSLHKLGFTLGRLSTVDKMYNSSSRKNIFPYLKLPDKIYNYVRFDRPPKPLTDEYEKRRAVQLERLKALSGDKLQDGAKEFLNQTETKEPKITKKELAMEVIRDYEAGVGGFKSLTAAAKAKGLNPKTVRNIKSDYS